VHGGSALEQCYEGTVMEVKELGACKCALEQYNEGTVMVVKELGARWKCAGTVLRRDRDGREGARCTVEVRWSSDKETVMAVKTLGAGWKCARAVSKGSTC